MTEAVVRLNKFLAERLGISRREADDLIAAGRISVNGKVAALGARVSDEDEVVVIEADSDGKSIKTIDKNSSVCYHENNQAGGVPLGQVSGEVNYIYLALNKPAGYVCSRKKQGEAETIYALLPEKYRQLKPVGRLDKDSSGLILLTNDGTFSFEMTHPKFVKSKEYEVELDRALAPLHQQMITDFGIKISDGVSKFGLERLDDSRKRWKVTMSEGRNRQIRRTFGALGYTVVDLYRKRFGKYELNGLQPGEFEEIKP